MNHLRLTLIPMVGGEPKPIRFWLPSKMRQPREQVTSREPGHSLIFGLCLILVLMAL